MISLAHISRAQEQHMRIKINKNRNRDLVQFTLWLESEEEVSSTEGGLAGS
jgi:hypothetical protein